MKVLIIGSGGREHALAYSIKKSKEVDEVYVSPGNPGMEEDVKILSLEDGEIVKFSKENKIDLVVIGPEDPLCNGLGDQLRKEDIRVFGPSKEMAQLEGSKAFSKEFMKKYGVATASYESFSDYDKALNYLKEKDRVGEFPQVIKASGLAQGKGVVICKRLEDGVEALRDMMLNKAFKDAGETVVIEEFLEGKETSILSIYDGHNIYPMVSSMDHKKIGEGETGLNTGGMGTIAPSPYFTKDVEEDFRKNILDKTLMGLKKESFKDPSCIFFGLMITKKGVKLLEYNMRFGDPETQVVSYLLEGDLFKILNGAVTASLKDKSLDMEEFKFSQDTALCFVLAAEGYPKSYVKDIKIDFKKDEDIKIFYAGVKKGKEGLLSSGGRILGLVSKGRDKKEIQNKIIDYIEKNKPNKTLYRRDIGNV